MTNATDTSDYPDCNYLQLAALPSRFTILDIGEPQGIEAPPAELVDGPEPSTVDESGADDPQDLESDTAGMHEYVDAMVAGCPT